jgi:ketosteroid isomerase-like protein
MKFPNQMDHQCAWRGYLVGQVLFILFFSNCSGTRLSTSRQQIKMTRHQFNQAIAQRDTHRIGEVCTPDYTAISSRNAEFKTRAGEVAAFENEFKSKPSVLYIRKPKKIQINEKWNMASESGRWIGTWQADGNMIQVIGSYAAKWHRLDGVWKIRAELFTPIRCTGGSYCDDPPIK